METNSENEVNMNSPQTNSALMYDAYCKRVFAEKEILAWIMRLAVDEFKNMTAKEIMPYIEGSPEIGTVAVMPDETNVERIHGDNTEDTSVNEGVVYYDIRFRATTPGSEGQIELILNVETQNRNNPGYPLIKRAIYYCARMLSAQKTVDFHKSEYDKLKKVYSIWIINHPPEAYENTVTEYDLREHPRIGQTALPKQDYDLLKIVFLYLGDHQQKELNETLRLLDILRANLPDTEKTGIMKDDFQITITERIDKEVAEMCNWSQGVMEEGIKQGRQEGKYENMLKVFMKLLASGFSFDAAAETAGAETKEDIDFLRKQVLA